jgi:hypothetical protein
MKDMTEHFLFHDASLQYLDGPQEGFVEERSSGAWYRFRCVRVAHETWVWLLARAAGSAEADPKDFERADWSRARMFLETRTATGGTVEEYRAVDR